MSILSRVDEFISGGEDEDLGIVGYFAFFLFGLVISIVGLMAFPLYLLFWTYKKLRGLGCKDGKGSNKE